MSYAGPASRSKRAPDIAPTSSGSARPSAGLSRSPLRELPSVGGSAAVFAAGVALGVVVGAGVALLVAPNSGYETRRALVRRGRKVSRRGIDAWDDLRDELRQAVRNKRRAWRLKRQRARDAEQLS
jgi:hypothetical protein